MQLCDQSSATKSAPMYALSSMTYRYVFCHRSGLSHPNRYPSRRVLAYRRAQIETPYAKGRTTASLQLGVKTAPWGYARTSATE